MLFQYSGKNGSCALNQSIFELTSAVSDG